MKTSNDEKKALQDENKILKATIHSIERSLESVTWANHDLEQYTRRACVEIQRIPVAVYPSEEQTNNIVKDVGKLRGASGLLKMTYRLTIEYLNNAKASLDHWLS